ncbi:MAG: 16S rRNA (cytidine(1402)-2'-O)-methyltransferase [Candidatus Nomurabacteria bacterium]|nr:16S rRNA (cytidine(1402)-2'-O)-methyltransferase [Candidatus Nomurabacteria bacterium]USN88144.1 MAG: 16S rRNA (cytidine(1402)-2'-O)-methyltransferase [Candidatus Nomurabacteria bacterium]
MGTLYIVATPIGNLEDITLRAIRILGEVDYVLCEDTRVTGKLLSHYDIKTPMKRYDAHTSEKVHESVLGDLEEGKNIALVSDAGTPGVSDPGVMLVGRARLARAARIDAIPGPSAVTAAFSISGITGNQFTFLGFVPQKKGRETFFKCLATFPQPAIFFESTHRILKTLESLAGFYPEARVSLGRELTKLHEEMLVGTPAEVLEILNTNSVKQKGEFVVILQTGGQNLPKGRALHT